jgi:hypothetical protein
MDEDELNRQLKASREVVDIYDTGMYSSSLSFYLFRRC